MSLLVRHPPGYGPERHYILHVLLGEFLGLNWSAETADQPDVTIEMPAVSDGFRLRIRDGLFSTPLHQWLEDPSMPRRTVGFMPPDLVPPGWLDQPLPVLYGTPDYDARGGDVTLGLDIFGSAFFMLARYEELVDPARDRHGRFPASASVAHRHGFLDRPVVNEYAELLWHALKSIWPTLERRPRTFRTMVTCDVDTPVTCWARALGPTVRKALADIARRHSAATAIQSLQLYGDHRRDRYDRDPLYNFAWIMDVCESHAHTATFYFIAGHTSNEYDGCYRIDEPIIRKLLRDIRGRGHSVGLHGSYGSCGQPAQLRRERDLLGLVLDQEAVAQEEIGGRQHYLRWDPARSATDVEAAGLNHDSTLGFADAPGFRSGTCFEYPLFDIKTRRMLKIRERPLALMEQSVLSPLYLGLGSTQGALDRMMALKQTCRRYGGDFVLLWHNSTLISAADRQLYLALLAH